MNDRPIGEREPDVSSAEASEPPAILSGGPSRPWGWAVGLFAAAALAVVALNHAPQPYELPEELSAVGPTHPAKLQQEAMAMSRTVRWRNTVLAYALAGGCFSMCSVSVARWRFIGRASLAVVGGLACGIAGGALLAVIAFAVRNQLNAGLLGLDQQPIAGDLIGWMIASILMAFPATIALWIGGEKLSSQKVIAVPVAGLTTGLLFPVAISLLLPSFNTGEFPPQGFLVTGSWMALLASCLLLFTTFTGAKSPAPVALPDAAEDPK